MPTTGRRCLVRGSINIDEFFHVPAIVQPGETLSSTHYERRSGGKGANQAVAVSKAGASVTLVGAVGSDGDWVVNGLKQVGVDVDSIIVSENEPTGRAIIQLTPEGENCIILHRGANYTLIPSSSVTSAPFTHLLIQNEIPFTSTLEALAHANQIGATTLFNPSPMPSGQQLRDLPWKQLDWLIVNQGEVLSLLKVFHSDTDTHTKTSYSEPPSTWPSHPDIQTSFSLLHRLHDHPSFSPGVNLVCTLGGLGVTALLASGEALYVPAAKLERPVKDTTGAGDCFTGYLVAGLMESNGMDKGDLKREIAETILRTAAEAAGICVQRAGATESIPYRKELQSS